MKPKRWNVLTWSLLALWGTLFVFFNYPFEPDLPPKEPSVQLQDGSIVTPACNHAFYQGYPFTFRIFHIGHDIPTTRDYFYGQWIANYVLGFCTFYAIIWLVQSFLPKFTIKVALLGTAIFAGILSLGQHLWYSNNLDLMFMLVHVVFFFPLGLAVILLTFTLLQKTRDNLAFHQSDGG